MMGDKLNYGIVTGPWLSGKSTVAKHLSAMGNMVIDSKAIQEEIKKSYEELPDPPESVPVSAVIDVIKK